MSFALCFDFLDPARPYPILVPSCISTSYLICGPDPDSGHQYHHGRAKTACPRDYYRHIRKWPHSVTLDVY